MNIKQVRRDTRKAIVAAEQSLNKLPDDFMRDERVSIEVRGAIKDLQSAMEDAVLIGRQWWTG